MPTSTAPTTPAAPVSRSFPDLTALAQHLREELKTKKFVLLYAYNGTGKTRLSTEFKNLGKQGDQRDTLYFNAFTEDLFQWDNDLANDRERVLKINKDSRFFAGLGELEMDNRIRPLLDRYADFDFRIDTTEWEVSFSREVQNGDKLETAEDIKVSRGEENIFIWCFFLAIVRLVLDGAEAYNWVKYIYIDDPISSLDEQNAVAVAAHLATMLKDDAPHLKTVISTHHPLFFNVLYNELSRVRGKRFFFLGRISATGTYSLTDTGDTPFFHHVACLIELHEAARSGQIYTYHFNMLRVIAEKTASFLGYDKFTDCIKRDEDDLDGVLHNRLLNLLSHGKYSLYEPQEMLDENKQHFKKMLRDFTERFLFNPGRFPTLVVDEPPVAVAAPSSRLASANASSQSDSVPE
ncbi:AAA family ATPase [Azospirillum sp.]|uniref:AAA family ATPase n=1 Tax=Azospirillum sp. TaxID=34012 RepID=UPI002D4C20C4|nr:AAA family ATPase [Azospirillum sp.]HYD64142.1 AAA family ATPase [Azospirillum sp.]